MKILIIILAFASFSAFANFAKISEVESKSVSRVWMSESDCGSECMKIPTDLNTNYHVVADEYIDDTSNPIYSKVDAVTCAVVEDDVLTTEVDESLTQEQDCLAKEVAQVCDSANGYYTVRVEENTEVYCTKFMGYEQILSGKKIAVEDAALKTAYEAAQATAQATSDALAAAKERRIYGGDVMDLLIVRNAAKDLTIEQTLSQATTYAGIKGLLETGSLLTARAAILAIVPDGVIVTTEDQTALVDFINQYPDL